MKVITCTLFVLAFTLTSFSQETFEVADTKFTVQCPVNYYVFDKKNGSNPEGGLSNVVFKSNKFDECSYSIIGLQLVNTKIQPIPHKKRSAKVLESSAGYVGVGAYQCFYFSSKQKSKRKCNNLHYYASFSHRINDSLDVRIFLTSVALESEINYLDTILRTLADSFFIVNNYLLESLKPVHSFNGEDSISILNKGFYFPLIPGWGVTKRRAEFNDENDPTGKRLVIQEIRAKAISSCAITFTVTDMTFTKQDELNYFLNTRNRLPNSGERPMFAVRTDSIQKNCEANGFDTLSAWGLIRKDVNGEAKHFYAYYYSYFFMTTKGMFRVTLEFVAPISDPLQASFKGEEFQAYCDDVLKQNNFKKWMVH